MFSESFLFCTQWYFLLTLYMTARHNSDMKVGRRNHQVQWKKFNSRSDAISGKFILQFLFIKFGQPVEVFLLFPIGKPFLKNYICVTEFYTKL
uniref:Secreted protein n=1 Tax=Pyxicephalus adspersus TaxID=30357 RepID=A0AAV3A6Q4_PYXAD|nr:TPA: hypothetical protein GDO54_014190 [Pyxicephalus adspersus]